MTRSWKDRVQARMRELGVSQAELAREVGASDAAISLLFAKNKDGSERTKSSKLRPKIERFLKMPTETPDPAKARIDAKWPVLDDSDRAAVQALVDVLAAKHE